MIFKTPDNTPQKDFKKAINERINDPLREGRMVTVKRTDGTLEKGWKITGFEGDGQLVVVQKAKDGQTIQKKIAIEKMEELNPPSESPLLVN